MKSETQLKNMSSITTRKVQDMCISLAQFIAKCGISSFDWSWANEAAHLTIPKLTLSKYHRF